VLLDSVPTALLPALQDTSFAGTFGAQGHFAFDTRSLDDLELDYTIADKCRVVVVPAFLSRDRFRQPFVHNVYLPDGSIAEQTTGPTTDNWTPLEQISPFMQVAVLTTEDGAFPRHRGYNHAAIRASIVANLKARRFARGASTITMQLAKNLFLSRDKTLARKLEEVVLTDYLEQTFSKDELMELYLNVIEFGPAVYGITAASEYYFGRAPAELNLAECLFLSSLLPAPRRYGTMRDAGEPTEGWMRTLHNLMQVANKRGLVTDAELAEGLNEPVAFWRGGDRPAPRPPVPQKPRPRRDVGDVGLGVDEADP
jgi:membrane peptidoglycan carboxypeptidase